MPKAPPRKSNSVTAPRKPFANKRNVGRITGRRGQKLRDRRLKRSNYLCEDCLTEGKVREATIVDHIVPLSLGGRDVDENTRNLCAEHDKIRTAEQFRGHRGRGRESY